MNFRSSEIMVPDKVNLQAGLRLMEELRCDGSFSSELAKSSSFRPESSVLRARIDGILGSHETGRIQTDIVAAISALLNGIDDKLGDHQGRVAALSAGIAEEMGLSPNETKLVMDGAWLHDFGKIYIPKDVLYKAGRLTDEEFAHIKEHPVLGAEKLASVFGRTILSIVMHHHENVNGSGYPHGLRGDQISLSAKIVKVADSYDAMTQRAYNVGRPSRGSLSHERALSEIYALTGSHYDPKVVDAFSSISGRIDQVLAA